MARVPIVPQPRPRPTGATVRRHFGPSDRIVMGGVAYRCVETTDDGHVFQAAHDEVIHKPVRHDDLPAIEDEPGYRHDRDYYQFSEAKARLRAGVASLTHLPAAHRARVLHRFEYAQEFLRLEASDPTINRGDASVDRAIVQITENLKQRAHAAADQGRRKRSGRQKTTFDPPGRKALLKWVNALLEGNLNPLALCDDYTECGNRKPYFSENDEDLIEEFIDRYLVPREPSIRGLRSKMALELPGHNEKRIAEGKEPLKLPSYAYLREKVDALPKFEVVACRKGIAKALKKFAPVSGGIPDIDRPFQQCEMDHWNVQLHVLCKKARIWDELTDEQKAEVEKARYVLGMVVDRRTRCIAALRLTRTATAESAVELLEMAVTDKRAYALGADAITPWDIHGTPLWMFTDGAFANWKFKLALANLKINFEVPPAGLAHMRGLIERSFRTIHEGAVSHFDGRTFQNIIRKGDYDSEGRAGNTVDELAIALVRFAADVHHNTPHPSLNYKTPRECWVELTRDFGVDSPPDWDKRRHVFGLDFERTLGPTGLRFLNIPYRSKKLHEHFLQHGSVEMDIRVHEQNLGAISVRIDDKHLLTVPGPPEFKFVTADDWIASEADLRRRGYQSADVTASVRQAAFAAINRDADIGRKRIGIDDARTTAQQLLQAEKQMKIAASFPEDQPGDADGDLYDDALTVGEQRPQSDPAESPPDDRRDDSGPADDRPEPPSQKPRRKRRWTLE